MSLSWRERIKTQASFRNIPFLISDTEMTFGRRNVLHEYPLRDIPYAEDLGKKAREFTINAYFIGEEYIGNRDRLIKAIEENDTPGTLVHPTLGMRQVIPKECRERYSNQEGGIEYVTLTFIDAGVNVYPEANIDTRANMDAKTIDAHTNLKDQFNSTFTVASHADFVATNASKNALVFADSIENIAKTGNINKEEYSNFQNQIKDFKANVSSYVYTPSQLSSGMSGLIQNLSNLFLSQTTIVNQENSPFLSSVKPLHPEILALNAQKKLQVYGDTFIVIQILTSSREQEYINQVEMINLIKNTSLIEMARILSLMNFDSREDAVMFRDEALQFIDPQILYLGDIKNDEAFHVLNDIRTAMVIDINIRAATLRNITYKQIRYAIPALAYAYQEYNDATKEAEIVARNKIRNPAFMPALRKIELLV